MDMSVEKYSEKLLLENKILNPPIDINKIAKSLKIDIQYEKSDGELSGLLIIDNINNISVIGINSKHHKYIQRFIIAHEIGHYLFHKKHGLYIDTSIKINFKRSEISFEDYYKEIEANSFALALLMPEEMLKECIEKKYNAIDYNDNSEINKIADEFEVTTHTLMIRLGALGMF